MNRKCRACQGEMFALEPGQCDVGVELRISVPVVEADFGEKNRESVLSIFGSATLYFECVECGDIGYRADPERSLTVGAYDPEWGELSFEIAEVYAEGDELIARVDLVSEFGDYASEHDLVFRARDSEFRRHREPS